MLAAGVAGGVGEDGDRNQVFRKSRKCRSPCLNWDKKPSGTAREIGGTKLEYTGQQEKVITTV